MDEIFFVLYLLNLFWIGYSNFLYIKGVFINEQFNDILENVFQFIIYGNGMIDLEWFLCLVCVMIKCSLVWMDMNLLDQCKKCFERYCWYGKESNVWVIEVDLDF